ncbi:MAG: hypothetical protein CBB95_17785 [Alteromonas sp. TMED35]|uniref:hypothetical protein n=1 Tax=uncultured Alteromonas sp. TaxID=179113 RepID=UPI000B66DC84|nr:MAG: hypothetical protein CBB95_17785 [Alteromonas sp. TMED35]|tara:strand:+ start:54205 stop:54855 length:651 start_codon:yes stop_codon:yes gene_type:complete
MNTIILNCNNVNEHFADSPSYFVITLNDWLNARISALSAAVTSVNAGTITDYISNGTYCDEAALYDCAEANGGMNKVTEDAIDKQLEQKDYESCRVDCQTLVVSGSTFRFEALPKYLGDDCKIETMDVPIEVIEYNNRYAQLQNALDAEEWGDARSILDVHFGDAFDYTCDFLKNLLNQYQEKVTFTFDAKEKWSYTEAPESQISTENNVVEGVFA